MVVSTTLTLYPLGWALIQKARRNAVLLTLTLDIATIVFAGRPTFAVLLMVPRAAVVIHVRVEPPSAPRVSSVLPYRADARRLRLTLALVLAVRRLQELLAPAMLPFVRVVLLATL